MFKKIIHILISALMFFVRGTPLKRTIFFNGRSIIQTQTLALGALFFIIVVPVGAMPLHVDAQAAMTSGFNQVVTTYLPIGTVVDASVSFDLGIGTPTQNFTISSLGGTFTWNDGSPETFNVSNVNKGSMVSTGLVSIDFFGTGPTIGGFTATEFEIVFNIGVNPFTTSNNLSDLLLGSTIDELRIGVFNGVSQTSFGDIATNVSGSVSAIEVSNVPEPTTLWLLSSGIMMGLLGFCRQKLAV
jgi:hypothetical protein